MDGSTKFRWLAIFYRAFNYYGKMVKLDEFSMFLLSKYWKMNLTF